MEMGLQKGVKAATPECKTGVVFRFGPRGRHRTRKPPPAQFPRSANSGRRRPSERRPLRTAIKGARGRRRVPRLICRPVRNLGERLYNGRRTLIGCKLIQSIKAKPIKALTSTIQTPPLLTLPPPLNLIMAISSKHAEAVMHAKYK